MARIDAEAFKYIYDAFDSLSDEQIRVWADEASGGGEATLAEADKRLVSKVCVWMRGVLRDAAKVRGGAVDATAHRATPEQWGGTLTACILELRSRLEALEAGATCPHVRSSDEGTSYCGLAEQTANSQPSPNDRQIRSSLVERVGRAISLDAWDDAGNWTAEARAAIRAVAEWLRENEISFHAAYCLDREVK